LIKDEFKTDSNVIKGCQSKYGCKEKTRWKIVFTADSDAILTKELSILIRTFQIKPLSLF
jgi:cysteine desulfuration protein SufE